MRCANCTCVPGPRICKMPRAWFLEQVQRYEPPIPIKRQKGTVGIQYGPKEKPPKGK